MTSLEPGFSDRNPGDYVSGVVVEVVESRDGEAFFVEFGHTDDFVDQLIRKSREDHIVQNCPRDSEERFSSREAFLRWLQKDGGRSPYFLTDTSGEVAGLVWYGYDELGDDVMPGFPPEYLPDQTFAVRVYEGYDGRGLARDFIKASMQDHLVRLARESQSDDFNGFHLETDTDNAGAIHLYEKIGFRKIDDDEGKDRIRMVLTPEDAYRFIGAAPVE